MPMKKNRRKERQAKRRAEESRQADSKRRGTYKPESRRPGLGAAPLAMALMSAGMLSKIEE
jgi:hypothetical protein